MALNSLVSGQGLCCAGELGLSWNLPQVSSPVPGGRCSPLCLWECSHLRAQEGSWWFGLTWVLAAFLHSSHGTKQASTITALDQADRTHTGAPWLQQGCPMLSIRGLASSAVGWQKGVVCRAAGTGGFFVPPGHLVASKEPGVCCQSATR